jgi:hypothetical protein
MDKYVIKKEVIDITLAKMKIKKKKKNKINLYYTQIGE